MPRKAKVQTGESAQDETPKPKRKVSGRKKIESAESNTPAEQKSEEFSPQPMQEEPIVAFPEPQSNPLLHTGMRDIKPKPGVKDADFLAPEYETFGLKAKKKAGSRKALTFVLGFIVLIFAVGLLALTIYSNKSLNNNQPQSAAQNQKQNTAQQTQAVSLKIYNSNPNITAVLGTALSSNFQDISVTSTNLAAPKTPTEDTIYFKKSALDQVTKVTGFLTKYGINPKIENDESISSEIILDLVDILPNPNVGKATSAVYNATGVSGLAKKYCAVLIKYGAASCSALNSTTQQTGTTITYKDVSSMMVLARTSEFKSATFSAADPKQVEDIRVTLGK